MWSIDEPALHAIAIGAGILGTGGGGNPYLGMLMAREQLRVGRTISVVSLEEVSDDALVCSVGGMGSPTVGIERLPRGDEYLVAFRALERHIGRTFTHLIPGEIGGSNATRPLVVAAQTGLPVIDADAMGRAFPELQMDTFAIAGIPQTPAVLADLRHQIAIFDAIEDAQTLERYARVVTIQMGGSAAYAFPPMSGADVHHASISGTLTFSRKIGDAVLQARKAHRDPIAAILQISGGHHLLTGKITDVDRRLVGGFARGHVLIDGSGEDESRSLRIDLQNENLIARDSDGEVVAVVPDLICILDAETGEPISTEVLRYGLRVVVLGIPAPVALKSEAALKVIGPAAFGYHEVTYQPLPGTYGVSATT